jgi:hypothetical protein
MVKAHAEPGLAPQRDAGGHLVYDSGGALVYTPVAERWAGAGRTIFDNKGQPVKQYDPYFSSVPHFEDEADLVQQGVTPLLRHDPLGRLVRTDPVSRTEFDAWSQTAWDPNDTSGEAGNAWTAARQPGAVPATSAEGQRAATLSLAHTDTPATTHVDALGRVFLAQARLDGATVAEPRPERDFVGQMPAVRVALKDGVGGGRVCAQSVSAIGGQVMRSSHVDSGEVRIDSDTPELRTAVETEVRKLRSEFKDWTFTTSLGAK